MDEVKLLPWSFDADENTITLHDMPIFTVMRESDFPCIEDDERAAVDVEYLAHANVAVMLLNMVATTTEPTVGEALAKLTRPTLVTDEVVERVAKVIDAATGFYLPRDDVVAAARAAIAAMPATPPQSLGDHARGAQEHCPICCASKGERHTDDCYHGGDV